MKSFTNESFNVFFRFDSFVIDELNQNKFTNESFSDHDKRIKYNYSWKKKNTDIC